MNLSGELSFPFIYQSVTVRNTYGRLLLALLPLILFSVGRGGVSAFMVFVVAVAAGAVSEFILDLVRNPADQSSSRNGRILFLMLFLGLLLPHNTSPVVVAVAAAATVVVGVHLLGGPGVYYVNPVFIGLLIAGVTGVTTVPAAGSDLVLNVPTVADSSVFMFLTDYVFIPLGMRVPPESIAMILNIGDAGGVSLGSALVLPLLLGALIVFGEELVPAQGVVAFILAAVAVLYATGTDLVDLLIRSNLGLIIVFGMAEPSSYPVRRRGMVLFGASAGALAALLLAFPGTSMPVITAMVLVSTFLPWIDQMVVRR
jgi:Na+-translocating ferredoxin:NAD+ oxidoreductase RnfD subunit